MAKLRDVLENKNKSEFDKLYEKIQHIVSMKESGYNLIGEKIDIHDIWIILKEIENLKKTN